MRDDAQRGAVLTAFFGDFCNRAFARFKSKRGVGWHVAVSFFANQRYGNLTFAPKREVEGHAAEDRDHDVDDFCRQAGEFENRDRLAVDRNAEDAAQNLGHAVVNGQRAKHEGVAAILRNLFDVVLELPVRGEIALVLKFAHPFIDEAGQIRNAVGHWGIDGIAASVDDAAAQLVAFTGAAGRITALGDWDEFLQNLDFGLAFRITDENFDDFLEIQQPKRQLHVARRDHLSPFAEGGGVFVVRIKQHDMGGWVLVQDRAQDKRGCARFACAGRAKNGEVLAEQIVDADHGRNRTVLANAANADRRCGISAEGNFKFGF